jgi:hypothetical protein
MVEGVFLPIPLAEGTYLGSICLEFSVSPSEPFFNHIQVHKENVECLAVVQFWVIETDVDTGSKGFVKVTYAIGGEEENSSIILENPEEDYTHANN